ncbi:hypothetical protein [Streptomyces sp. NPDC054940]
MADSGPSRRRDRQGPPARDPRGCIGTTTIGIAGALALLIGYRLPFGNSQD